MYTGKGDKYLWVLVLSIFVVPLSGFFSSDFWRMQSDVLFICLSFLAIRSIALLNSKRRKVILWSIILLTIINGALVIFYNKVPVGASGSRNQSGLFFAATMPIIVKMFPLALPLSIYGLLSAKTSSAVFGCFCSMVFMTRYYKKIGVWISLALIIFPIVFFTKFDKIPSRKIQERRDLYKNTAISAITGEIDLPYNGEMYYAKCNPLFGFGLGTFKKLSPMSQGNYIESEHRYVHAHNDYLEIFFEFGWMGVLFIIIILWNGISAFMRSEKTDDLIIISSCLIVYIVSALGIFTIHTATSVMLLIILMGLYYGETKCMRY